MNRFTVVAQEDGFDDRTPDALFFMEHPTKNKADLVMDWNSCYEDASMSEEWFLKDIIKLMEQRGWSVRQDENPVTVFF